MRLVDRFHKMEIEYSLFDLGKEYDLPIWDILRYHVYLKYYYEESDRANLNIAQDKTFSQYVLLLRKVFFSLLNMVRCNGDIVFFSSSRYIDKNGKYFDKSVYPLLKEANVDYLVIESQLRSSVPYRHIYDFSMIINRFVKFTPKEDYQVFFKEIDKALLFTFGKNRFQYEEFQSHLKYYFSAYKFYKFIFRFFNAKKLFIGTGNPKAQIKLAKELKIKTYLLQHAGIEFDEIDYSYPYNITPKSNILFPDEVLTFGNYWCKNINVPSFKISVIGNDYFHKVPMEKKEEFVLVISTLVHGGELSTITYSLAKKRNDLKFIFKLHPYEYHMKDYYINLFKELNNVDVLSTEFDTNILIAKSLIILMIVSGVLYEALNQNKRVAILKKINFERQLTLKDEPNLYFFDSLAEFNKILTKPTLFHNTNYYSASDKERINKLLNV